MKKIGLIIKGKIKDLDILKNITEEQWEEMKANNLKQLKITIGA